MKSREPRTLATGNYVATVHTLASLTYINELKNFLMSHIDYIILNNSTNYRPSRSLQINILSQYYPEMSVFTEFQKLNTSGYAISNKNVLHNNNCNSK